MFVKYIPIYSMLSLAITQLMPREGKCLLDLKCLVWEERSGCRKETAREWYKVSFNPGLTRKRHIKSAAARRRKISKTGAPRCSHPKSLEFPILWVWFVKCFSWKDVFL